MRVQLLGATAPLKFKKAKNVQNSLLFRTTSEFERKYISRTKKILTSDKRRYQLLFFSTLNEKYLVNFCPVTTKLRLLISTY